MPCVLPVLSIKMLSLVEQSQENREGIWRHGLAYTAGVLASFLILAIPAICASETLSGRPAASRAARIDPAATATAAAGGQSPLMAALTTLVSSTTN